MQMFRNASRAGMLLMLLLLSGCQGSPQDDSAINDTPLDRRIGVIKSLGGVITDNQGTHLLQLDDGDTILLKSVAINLDDAKYVNKMAEVRGITTYAKSGKALMEVQNIDVLDQNYLPQDQESSAWSLYENSTYGWAMKYKSDFSKDESGSSVIFEKEVPKDGEEEDVEANAKNVEVYTISVKTTQNENNETLEKYLGIDGQDESTLLADGFKKSRVGTQSLSAYKEQVEEDISFFVKGSDSFYEISFKGASTPELLTYENVFYEMVTSFTLDNPGLADVALESNDDLIDSREVDEDFMGEVSTEGEQAVEVAEPKEVSVSVPESYAVYISDTFDFSVYYPKSWYFNGVTPTESGSIRRYDFSDKSFEEEDTKSLISLDVFGAGAGKGSKMTVNGEEIYKDASGGKVDYYVEKDGRTYKISGGSESSETMLNMISSIE